jgi:WD40 repeat protein
VKLFRCSPTLILAALGCLPTVVFGAENSGPRSDPSLKAPQQTEDGERLLYESWIRGYRAGPLSGALGIQQREIELVITVIEGDDAQTDAKTAAIFGPSYRIAFHGCAVAIDGTVSTFRRGSFGVQGGGLDQLTEDELDRLNHLIEQLPDDNSKLPPAGHRIVLQVATGSEILARVYDLANAPETVLEILRVSHSGIRPITLDFPVQKKWPVAELSKTGIPPNALRFRGPDIEETTILAISPDRYLTVRQVLHDTPAVTITDTNQTNVICVLRVLQPGNRFVGITSADFTPDGRYLMLLTTLPAIRIYDTQDWQLVGSLPEVPTEASLYYPSPDWKHGVAVYADGSVGMWDARSRRQIARIDMDGQLSAVSFSPDDSMVATTSGHENKDHSSTFHLRIWNVSTGEMIEELLPVEYTAHDDIGAPIWWQNGRYLLAKVRDNPFRTYYEIGIWGIASGRFRGGFSGCGYSPDPLSIVLHDSKLFERCRDGMILMWDAEAAIDKIAAYENSLAQSAEGR